MNYCQCASVYTRSRQKLAAHYKSNSSNEKMNYAAVVVILAALSAKGKKFTVISFVNNYQSNRYLVFYQQRLPVVRSAVSHGGR